MEVATEGMEVVGSELTVGPQAGAVMHFKGHRKSERNY